MNANEILQTSPFYPALKAAGIEAIRQARMHGTKLAIWRDGQVVEITPDEAEAMLTEQNAKDQE